MDENPYRSPDHPEAPSAPRARPVSRIGRVLRAMVRGAVVGAVIGTVGGVAILLLLGLWVRAPVLVEASPIRIKVIVVFMAFAVIPTTVLGAIGFGLSALLTRAKDSKPADGDGPQHAARAGERENRGAGEMADG